jgi:hypothetical protein
VTRGEEALREAMRLEQARIYSRTVTDVADTTRATSDEDMDSAVAYWRSRGQSVASIAFRLGCTKKKITESMDRMARAS